MAAVLPVAPVAAEFSSIATATASALAAPPVTAGFADLLASGLSAIDAHVAKADAMVASFAKGDAIPMHEVTLALEQARISVDLAAEVRTRLLEAYRDFMAMQL